ncbi:uncharacterized protein LOC135709334 [Ochlerotatus camptorhynchus]|uniref:uncharacterized protein LOC135709334 n=1 Tax=Ochlerotatus camptorhynchus TaxID=644619 RepID=UPI0031E2FA20
MSSLIAEEFIDSGFGYRTHSIRTAEMCRLCLKQRYLVDINVNQNLMVQLMECFPNFLNDDKDLPPFVCGECYQLIEITYQFTLRSTRTQVLLRSYVHEGGDFPRPEMLERDYRRAEKRSAPSEKEEVEHTSRASKKRRSSDESLKVDKKTRKSSKQTEKKERTAKKYSSKRSSEESTKSKVKDYYKSDEFLFGEEIDIENAKKRNEETKSVEAVRSDLQAEEIVSSLPNMSLKMSYEEMLKVIKTLECIENHQPSY